MQEHVTQTLSSQDGYLSVNDVLSTLAKFRRQSLFEGVSTRTALETFIAHRSAFCPPGLLKVSMTHKITLKRKGIPVDIPYEFGYCATFMPHLQQLLTCQDIQYCINNPREFDGVLRTVNDGLFYQYHPLVLKQGKESAVVYCVL